MIKKLVLGIAVCCGISGVSGMELIDDGETTLRNHLSELAGDTVGNKAVVNQLIKVLVDRELSADIVENVYYDLQDRKQCYVGQYNDFMEILNLLGMVHYIKCEGCHLEEESLLNAYNRGEFKEIETGGPFDEFEP